MSTLATTWQQVPQIPDFNHASALQASTTVCPVPLVSSVPPAPPVHYAVPPAPCATALPVCPLVSLMDIAPGTPDPRNPVPLEQCTQPVPTVIHPPESRPPVYSATQIILPSGDVSITGCANEVFQRIGPTQTLFERGGTTVEIVEDNDGVSTLSIVTPSAFRSRLENYGPLLAWRSGENRQPVLKPSLCPEETARALLDTTAVRKYLPRISLLTRCPVLVAGSNGVEILSKGFHARNNGILVTAGVEPREVELREAIASLVDLLSEFDFASEGDRSRAIASLITPGLKMGGLISGFVPVDVAEANQSQSGKTLRGRLIGAVYSERLVIVPLRKGGVGSVDESISQKLIEGRPFLQLDNFRGKLDSPFIEALLTADSEISARVPHRPEVRIDPSRFFIFLSSNGVETTRDFANRSSIIRIRKKVGYTFRRYPEGDILEHVRARQDYYLGAVFAVIREWITRGKLRTDEVRHDFREWDQTLDWIVRNIFAAAPLMDGHQSAQQRVSDVNLTFLRSIAQVIEIRGCLGRCLTSSEVSGICEDEQIEIPGLKGSGQQKPELRIGIVMRKAFSDCLIDDDGRSSMEIEGFTVTRTESKQPRTDGGGDLQRQSLHVCP